MKRKIKLSIILTIFVVVFSVVSCGNVFADIAEQAAGVQNNTEIQLKQPISKKRIALKFLLAMFGVAASSVIIFVLLSIYNNLMYSGKIQKIGCAADNDLKTPTNMKDALNIFLKKTK